MVNYQNGKIYTIRNQNDPSLIYVGSTSNTLSQRLNSHKQQSKCKYQIPFYQQIEDWSDWYIELYENYPCNNKEELNKREGEIIRQIGTLNKVIAGRTQKERYVEDKERINQVQREYREKNRERLREGYRKFREKHRERLKEVNRKFREENREKIYEKKREMIVCVCGASIQKNTLSIHKKSNKHQEYVANNPI